MGFHPRRWTRVLRRPLARAARGGDRELTLTADEFERAYAERSGVTVEWLRKQGLTVRPCDCGEEGCEGWQSVSQEAAADIDDPEKPWAR